MNKSNGFWIPPIELRDPAVLDGMSFEEYVELLRNITPQPDLLGRYLTYGSLVAEVEAEKRNTDVVSLLESINAYQI